MDVQIWGEIADRMVSIPVRVVPNILYSGVLLAASRACSCFDVPYVIISDVHNKLKQ